MFGIDATEMLVIVIVAVVVIGPKDLPLALRTAGRWIGKMRKMSSHFRSGFDAMVREAELEEMEKKWKAQNEKIMREHPQGGPAEQAQTGAWPSPAVPAESAAVDPAAEMTPLASAASTEPASASAEARVANDAAPDAKAG